MVLVLVGWVIHWMERIVVCVVQVLSKIGLEMDLVQVVLLNQLLIQSEQHVIAQAKALLLKMENASALQAMGTQEVHAKLVQLEHTRTLQPIKSVTVVLI